MRKILGGKENACPLCGGMVFFLEIDYGVVSQCKDCGCLALALSWLKIKFTRDYQGNYVFERTEKFNYAWAKLNHLRKELEEWEEK